MINVSCLEAPQSESNPPVLFFQQILDQRAEQPVPTSGLSPVLRVREAQSTTEKPNGWVHVLDT